LIGRTSYFYSRIYPQQPHTSATHTRHKACPPASFLTLAFNFMDFTNINVRRRTHTRLPIPSTSHTCFSHHQDPAGVKALLDQLRASQAWQQTIANSDTTPSPAHEEPLPTASSSPPSPTVASLLSQLSAPAVDPPPDASISQTALATPLAHSFKLSSLPPPDSIPAAPTATTTPVPSSAPRQDLRSCTFQQALPHLARLAEDAEFVSAVTAMKQNQNELERRLLDERRGVQKAQQEKVKKALTRASMIGAGTMTQYEANSMTEAFRRELVKFDTERALPAWDGLISKQQSELEGLGVPSMYLTTLTADRERQQRVVHVLAGMGE